MFEIAGSRDSGCQLYKLQHPFTLSLVLNFFLIFPQISGLYFYEIVFVKKSALCVDDFSLRDAGLEEGEYVW